MSKNNISYYCMVVSIIEELIKSVYRVFALYVQI